MCLLMNTYMQFSWQHYENLIVSSSGMFLQFPSPINKLRIPNGSPREVEPGQALLKVNQVHPEIASC